jgi:hypothetical protein
MYEARTCRECKAVVFYPDEMVAGFWVYNDSRPRRENEWGVLDWEDYESAVPEGAKVYCLNCAPCECGDHERLVAHTARNIVDWQKASV